MWKYDKRKKKKIQITDRLQIKIQFKKVGFR